MFVRSAWKPVILIAASSAATHILNAGGIILYEIATPDVGLASAGYASRADDASTVYKNPAGMSNLDGWQIDAGLQALYGDVQFSPSAGTTATLGPDDGGNAIGWLPGASLFVVAPLDEDWRVGFGMFSYFGLAEDYNDNWVGRYYVQDSTLLGFSLMPSVSYQATDWLSVGVGLNAMLGYLKSDMAVNNVIGPDGQLSLKDSTWGFGANVGIMIEVDPQTRIGMNYMSPVELEFSDTPSYSGLGPGLAILLANPRNLDLAVTVPQSVMLSLYHDFNEQWAVMADVGWQDWSQFGYVQAGVDAIGVTTVELNFKDTWHGAIGVQYRPTTAWEFTGGLAYDSSAVDDANRTVTLPVGEAWRFGAGAQYALDEQLTLGLAYTFLWAGDMPVNQGSPTSRRGLVTGSFEGASFSFINLNANYRF